MALPKIVVFTGAGISAESGLKTFRDSDGLWENYRIEDVATPLAWKRDRALVLDFYNQRRRALLAAQPNAAHHALADLQRFADVHIITQNIDDLHERAGSLRVLHLHGELRKSRSTLDPSLVYPIAGTELNLGDRCQRGSQLRPHVVWFHEEVPMLPVATNLVESAEAFMVIGSSLIVYPAAGLIEYVAPGVPVYAIDPRLPDFPGRARAICFEEPATTGVPKAIAHLQNHFR